jgi:hypothetical protein
VFPKIMAKKRVGVLEAHEPPKSVDAKTFCGRAIAERLIATGEARSIGKRLIQMVRAKACDAIKQAKASRDAVNRQLQRELEIIKLWDGPLGRGNLLPFAKAHNYGDLLHYEMPMAGDRTPYARSRRRAISVSSRSFFRFQILPLKDHASQPSQPQPFCA